MSCTGVDAPPPDLKQITNREKWEVVSKEMSNTLLTLIRPRLVLSGHTHHGCYLVHEDGTPELTIPSFSWRNRNNPSFVLVSEGSTLVVSNISNAHETASLEAFRFKGKDDYEGDIFSLMRAREPASFWRGKVTGVVILPRALARMRISGNKLSLVKSLIIFPSGEGQTAFNENNHANYCGEKICNKAFQGVYFVEHKNFKLHLVVIVVLALVLESIKGL